MTMDEALDMPLHRLVYGVAAWRLVNGDDKVREPEKSEAMKRHLERMANHG